MIMQIEGIPQFQLDTQPHVINHQYVETQTLKPTLKKYTVISAKKVQANT